MKSQWEKDMLTAREQLVIAQRAFSRSGLYLTSLLLQEVLRVAEYETATEIARYKELLKERKKR